MPSTTAAPWSTRRRGPSPAGGEAGRPAPRSEHLAPGQWAYARQPSRKELAATRLLALSLDEASVKIRTGPPDDGDSPDAALGLWAGELPLRARWQELVPDPAAGIPVAPPAHLRAIVGRIAGPVPPERG